MIAIIGSKICLVNLSYISNIWSTPNSKEGIIEKDF